MEKGIIKALTILMATAMICGVLILVNWIFYLLTT